MNEVIDSCVFDKVLHVGSSLIVRTNESKYSFSYKLVARIRLFCDFLVIHYLFCNSYLPFNVFSSYYFHKILTLFVQFDYTLYM